MTDLTTVHNDFRNSRGIFPLFEGLEVPALDKPAVIADQAEVNGVAKTNGVHENDENKDSKSAYEAAKLTKNEQQDEKPMIQVNGQGEELKN